MPAVPSSVYPFDRTMFPPKLGLTTSDLNLAVGQLDATMRMLLLAASTGRYGNGSTLASFSPVPQILTEGFWQNGFRVRPTTGLNVEIASGLGFQFDLDLPTNISSYDNLNDLCGYKPLYIASAIEVAVPVADSNPRIDLIEVRHKRVATDFEQYRELTDPANGVVTEPSGNRRLTTRIEVGDLGYVVSPADSSTTIGYKTGVPAGPPTLPTLPTVTAGYVALAYVYVPAGATTIANGGIRDARRVFGSESIRLSMTKASTLAGGITVSGADLGPGVQVDLVNNPGIGAAFIGDIAFDVYVFSEAAARLYANNAGALVVPVQATINSTNLPTGYTTNVRSFATARLVNSTDVTLLADGAKNIGGARTTYAALGMGVFLIRTYFEEWDGSTITQGGSARNIAMSIDFNIPRV